MGTGWRRAFCTTIPRETEESISDQNASPQQIPSCVKLGIFSSITSNPTTPRLRCRTTRDLPETQSADNTPRLRCKISGNKPESPRRRKMRSTPSSPRSPFNIFKTSLRSSKSGCGVCLKSVKPGQGMAIYTAECSHSFHFPCIAQLVRKQGSMVCPVCNSTWKEVPLLSAPHNKTRPLLDQNDVVDKTITTSSTTRTNHGVFQDGDDKLQASISAVKTKQICQSKPLDDFGKPFNDDEPLLSPTAGARFNPIPEAENEGDEDAGEFQGFFVNPSTPTKISSTASVQFRRNQGNVEVKLLPEAAVISVGRSHETFAVALRVKAPPLPPISNNGGVSPLLRRRAPIDLVTVLELSGSMDSSKLQMLKRAMRLVISSLGSSDRLSIIAFSSSPQRLLPLRRMSYQGQRLARRIVDHLTLGEGKSVTSAMKLAAKVVEDRREKNPCASIILLSDGKNETETYTGYEGRATFCQIEVPLCSIGVAEAFAKRVGGLLSVVVQDLRVELNLSSGEIAGVYSSNGKPRLVRSESIRLSDLYAEEERELLLEVRVPTSAMGSHHVMSVRCSYREAATGEVVYERERALLVPRPHAVRSSDPRIERLRNVFLATRAVAETRRHVEKGNYSAGERILISAQRVVGQSCSASAEEYVKWLDVELGWVQQRRRVVEQKVAFVDENGEPLTPTSAWRAAEQLAKLATMKKALNRGSDLHGFENARF